MNKTGPQYSTNYLIRSYKSDSPIIILSGHGGKSPVNISPRSCNVPLNCDCKIGGDEYTNEIAEIVSQVLNSSLIIADFDRIYIDANRSPICAYEDPKGALNYNAFHNKLIEFISNIKSRYSIGFLFDLHGTRQTDWDVYIGTLHGNSIKQLLNIDPYAINKLRTLFIDMGYKVQPTYRGEKEIFQGRYILNAYGDNINSIQFEISSNIRNAKFATDLAYIIKEFVNFYDAYQIIQITVDEVTVDEVTVDEVTVDEVTVEVTVDDIIKYADTNNFINEEELKELLKILIE